MWWLVHNSHTVYIYSRRISTRLWHHPVSWFNVQTVYQTHSTSAYHCPGMCCLTKSIENHARIIQLLKTKLTIWKQRRSLLFVPCHRPTNLFTLYKQHSYSAMSEQCHSPAGLLVIVMLTHWSRGLRFSVSGAAGTDVFHWQTVSVFSVTNTLNAPVHVTTVVKVGKGLGMKSSSSFFGGLWAAAVGFGLWYFWWYCPVVESGADNAVADAPVVHSKTLEWECIDQKIFPDRHCGHYSQADMVGGRPLSARESSVRI